MITRLKLLERQPGLLWSSVFLKLRLHDAILRFYPSSLIHILLLSNSHNNVASIQKNWGNKSHHVIKALCISQFQAWPSPPPPAIFLMGEFPTPRAKRVQNPHPRAYRNELNPTPGGIFFNYSQ